MNKVRISKREKLGLIIFGIFLGLLLLEIALRLGGFIFLSLQEYRNRISIGQKGGYRILCLGESTTALGGRYSWPAQLEEILNKEQMGIKFRVINKGIPAVTTSGIVSQLVENLNKYHPDMVITMMGVNDEPDVLPYAQVNNKINFLTYLRVYKLIKILSKHIISKFEEYKFQKLTQKMLNLDKSEDELVSDINIKQKQKEIEEDGDFEIYFELGRNCIQRKQYSEGERLLKKSLEINPKREEGYIALAWCYREQGQYLKAMKMLTMAKEINPRNSWLYVELGNNFKDRNLYKEAEEMYKKALEVEPENISVYLDLGDCYLRQGEYNEATRMFNRVITQKSKDASIYFNIGEYYKEQGLYKEAKEMYEKALEVNPEYDKAYVSLSWLYDAVFSDVYTGIKMAQKAIEINPENAQGYFILGECYQELCKYEEAITMLNKAIKINPQYRSYSYFLLGGIYLKIGKIKKAEEIYKKALKLNPKNPKYHAGLGLCYEKQGKLNLAKKHFRELEKLVVNNYNPIISRNYQELRRIVMQRKIKLVCVQYPMRSIKPLRRIFNNPEGIVFVDNEMIFKKAVQKEGYQAYFVDNFAGDFGHCTPKGNRLLAENIAKVILAEYFKIRN